MCSMVLLIIFIKDEEKNSCMFCEKNVVYQVGYLQLMILMEILDREKPFIKMYFAMFFFLIKT